MNVLILKAESIFCFALSMNAREEINADKALALDLEVADRLKRVVDKISEELKSNNLL